MHRRRPFSVARDDFFFFPCLEPPLLGVLCHVDIVAEPLMERHDAKTSSSGAKKAKIFFGARCRARQLPRPPPHRSGGAPEVRIHNKYSQRVGVAWVAYIDLYDFLKSGHDIPASQLTPTARSERGDIAVDHALNLQRAMLGLIGTHRRRKYAHDLVYGMHQLYTLFGKPWNAATEGNEHAHQDMKRFFHSMACHNPSHPNSDCYQVLRMTVIKAQLLHTKSHLLPASNYAAMRANRVLAESATRVEGKRRGCQSGPKGLKCWAAASETKRAGTAKRLREGVVGDGAWEEVMGTQESPRVESPA